MSDPHAPTLAERCLAGEIATRARGATVVVGEAVPALADALVGQVAPVVVVLQDAMDASLRERAWTRACASGAVAALADTPARVAVVLEHHAPMTVIVDADHALGALASEVAAWPPHVERLLVVGRRAGGPPGPVHARHAGPGPIAAAWAHAGASVEVVPIRDPARYLVDARRRRQPDGPPRGVGVTAGAAGTAPVTVVVPTAGRSPWLAEAIASALDQSAPPARVLVVADGCADAVRPVVAPFGAKVELLARPHGGQAAAMNAALREVTTPYVAWLDDDDAFEPRKLELQLAALEREADAVLSATPAFAVGPDGRILSVHDLPDVASDEWPRLLLGGSHILGPTVLARTDHYRALGDTPYDETLPRAADHRAWLDLSARGPFHVLRLPLSRIRRHEGNAQTPARAAAMREAAQRTLSYAVSRWPLDHFFPAIERVAAESRDELRAGACLERAGRLLRVGLTDLALADVNAARVLSPDDVRVHHVEGIVRLERGELDLAEAAFTCAAARGAPKGEVACALGTIAWFRGEPAVALEHMARGVEADPRSLMARYNVALLRSAGASAHAVALLRESLGREPLPGYLLSPLPPADALESMWIAMRRKEAGLSAPGHSEG